MLEKHDIAFTVLMCR